MLTSKQIDFLQDLLAGGTAGAVSKTASAPLERVKLIMQTQKLNNALLSRPYTSPLDCVKRIYAEEGFWAFWRGNMASIYRYFPNHAMNFAFKDLYKRHLKSNNPSIAEWETKHKVFHNLIGSGLAGAVSLAVCHPFDVARTKLAADVGAELKSTPNPAKPHTPPPGITPNPPSNPIPSGALSRQYRGTWDCLSETYTHHGLRGVYRGVCISVVGALIYRALHIGGYDSLKEVYKSDDFLARFAMAQSVSLVCGVLIYPLDTLRRRMMFTLEGPAKYSSSLSCLKDILKHEGGKALYAGLSVNILRSFGAAVLLVSYDEIQRIMR